MKRYSYKNFIRIIISLIFAAAVIFSTAGESFAYSPIRLVVDNEDITGYAVPVLQNGRTLVPLRIVSEKLGAQVDWNASDRTVRITMGDRSVLLRIDSHLVEYSYQGIVYNLCDVAPQIINGLTFVPLRLISNALGIGINWDDSSRTVYVDSSQTSGMTPFFDMRITSVKPGQAITGKENLQSAFPSQVPAGAAEIKYLLLDPGTAKGEVIARGSIMTGAYHWLPDLRQNGEQILIAAVYDSSGRFLAGDSIPVQVAVVPEIYLTGLYEGQMINGSVSIGVDLNFSAYCVKYSITNLDNGKEFVSPQSDPLGKYSWSPMMEDNGNTAIKATAYDNDGRAYESRPIRVKTEVARKLALVGISAGKTIDGPVTLSVSRSFQVSETIYVMRDPKTGSETVLAKTGYASYKWFPGPELKGTMEILVRVVNTRGVTFSSSPVSINLPGMPRMILEGIGPQQVITGTVKLKVNSNIALDSVTYSLTNIVTGAKKVIGSSDTPLVEYAYTPAGEDAGTWKVQAEGVYEQVKAIASGTISVTIYTGKIYTPLPIIEKSGFINMISGMALDSMQKTGMSAALQTAQAIHESGWGQSVPVDKYSGQFSYNLFGIKGTGTAGSIISNTWEEYNGIAYRIDDKFRAYNNVGESWSDHKSLLLNSSRYGAFRDVMHDSTQGAWALKRAGYATDSKYPLKLIDIINYYDLWKLDQVGI